MFDDGQSYNPPAKVNPETLVFRGTPRRVVRFKRYLLIGIAAIAAIAIFAATWLALGRTHFTFQVSGQEAANIGPKRMPDSIAALPSNYSKVKLGPPMPGDLGPSLSNARRAWGSNRRRPSSSPVPKPTRRVPKPCTKRIWRGRRTRRG